MKKLNKRGLIIVSLLFTVLILVEVIYADNLIGVVSCGYTSGGGVVDCTSKINESDGISQDVAKNYRLNLNFSEPVKNGDVLFINITSAIAKFINLTVCGFNVGCNFPNYGWVYIPSAGGLYNITLNLTETISALTLNSPIEQAKGVDYIYVSRLDSEAPFFSGYIESPANNSAYVIGQTYKFNVTVNETNPGMVWINWNGINYTTEITNISNVYSFNRSNLAAGTYNYTWWANDTLGNINNSGIKYYTIARAENTLTLLSSSGWSYNYGISSTFSCSAIFGTPLLYINNLEVSNPTSSVLAAGNHNVKCNISQTQNYSSGVSQGTLTVNKNPSSCQIFFNESSPIIYGNLFRVWSDCSSEFKLYREGIEINNYSIQSLTVGIYNFSLFRTDTQNYSNIYDEKLFTINKASSQVSLIFDKTSPQAYGNLITPFCSVVSGVGSPVLMMDGEIISSGVALNLGAGNYNFNCSLADSQNYSYSENVSSFSIDSASTTTNVIVNPGSGVDYGTESNFSCSNSNGLETILYVNGEDKNPEKGLNIIRAAGNYTVNCTSIANQNYSASSDQKSYIINKTIGEIRLYLNGQENNVTIDYPQQYNITAISLYGEITIYNEGIDITLYNGNNVTPPRASGLYNITAVSSGDENHSSASITRWLNVTLDEIAPEINIISPQDGASYGENTGISLNFSVSEEHLDSCWYNINNGENITLTDCRNSTLDFSVDGGYTVYLYANDTLGNLGVKTSTFSILVGAPTVILNSPIGIYFNTHNITFRYTPSDLDLESCELWGNFDGEFKLNQTTTLPMNNLENIFNLNLPDGTYKWNIRCNDSLGHSAFNGNKTFYIDTIPPTITLLNPIGIKKSRTVSANWIISDSSPATCIYNVYRGLTLEIENTSVVCSLNITSFSVTLDADFVFNFYVKDFANNFNSANSSFSVDSLTSVPPSSGGGASSGGGGSFIAPNQTGKLSVSRIGIVIAREGDKKTLSLNVKNVGRVFLNKCRLISSGDLGAWIYSTNLKGIAPGESFDFVFDLNVPQEISSGDYTGKLEIKCDEGNDSQDIIVSIPRLEAIIVNEIIQQGNLLIMNYSFDNSKFVGESVVVDIWLTDEAGAEIKRVQDSFGINQDGLIERSVSVDVSGLSGLYSIYFALSSNLEDFIKQPIIIGKSSPTGFAVFDEPRNKNIAYVVFVLLIGLAVFFIWRRGNRKEKREENTTSEESSRPKWLLRKKAAIVMIFLVPIFIIIGFNVNLTGFSINSVGQTARNLLGALVFIFISVSAIFLVLNNRKSSESFVGKYPCLTNLKGKTVCTKEGEVLGKVEDVNIGDCKIENIKIKFNAYGRKKFNKKGMLIKYKVINKIGEIIILKDFESVAPIAE